MNTEQPTSAATDEQLPYGGTVEDYRRYMAKAGTEASKRQGALFEAKIASPDKPAREDLDEYHVLVHAATNAWSVVALLRWIDRKYGADAAFRAAAIAQDIGMNGDPWDDSLLEVEPDAEVPAAVSPEEGR